MNVKTLTIGALAATLTLSGCINDTRVAAGPVRANAVVAAPPPPPPAVVVAEPVYVPEPHDAYISVALDTDVVFVGGDTYIWYVGHDGHRYRHLYGHGDLRHEVFHRRAQLRLVMAHHQGHLPMQQVHAAAPPARGAQPARPPRPTQAHQPPPHKPMPVPSHTADADHHWHPGT